MNRESIMFSIDGVDGSHPRFVARAELITLFAAMAQSDLANSTLRLLDGLEVEAPDKITYMDYYTGMTAKELIDLLELHMRCVNAVQALLSLRHPDDLIEAHLPS